METIPSPVLTLQELLEETRFLKKDLQRLGRSYPAVLSPQARRPARDQSRKPRKPIPGSVAERPFSVHLRIDRGLSETRPDAKAVLKWADRAYRYFSALTTYFRDHQDRPDKLDRFPLLRRSRVHMGLVALSNAQCVGMLNQHEKTLLVELAQERRDPERPNAGKAPEVTARRKSGNAVLIPPDLPAELRTAMRVRRDTQAKACGKMRDIDRKTLRKLLRGEGRVFTYILETVQQYVRETPKQ